MVERHLPEDIVFDILIWLPVKPLIRFTCVSKRWRSKILYDPEFAKSQFRVTKSLRQNRLLIGTNGAPAPQVKSLDLPFADNSSIRKLNNIPMHEGDVITLLGSSNGLVFLQVRDSQGIHTFISNPSTGFFKKLSDPGFQIDLSKSYDHGYFGVGYLSATDDYKVLVSHFKVFYCRREDYVFGSAEVELYSLRANLLKSIKASCSRFSLDVGDARQGTYLNESLHWVGKYDDGVNYTILAFDLAEEEFRNMELPDDFDHKEYGNTLGLSSGDCLCISSYPKDTFEESIDLWIMREYGVPESWTKLTLHFPNRHTTLSHLKVSFMESSTVVANCNSRGTEFTRVEHKEGKIARYTIKEDRYDQMIDYEETLVWIDDYHDGGVQE